MPCEELRELMRKEPEVLKRLVSKSCASEGVAEGAEEVAGADNRPGEVSENLTGSQTVAAVGTEMPGADSRPGEVPDNLPSTRTASATGTAPDEPPAEAVETAPRDGSGVNDAPATDPGEHP